MLLFKVSCEYNILIGLRNLTKYRDIRIFLFYDLCILYIIIFKITCEKYIQLHYISLHLLLISNTDKMSSINTQENTKLNLKIGFIGAGGMALAMCKGFISSG